MSDQAALVSARLSRRMRCVHRAPPESFFLISALFHYMGPSFAVLMFSRVDVLGVAWLRIGGAAVAFALWRRPWRSIVALDNPTRLLVVRFGSVLAGMNCVFYLAIDRLPLSTVSAIEFLGTVALAALGVRTVRNAVAFVVSTAGVATLADIRLVAQPLGFLLAFANCVLFMLYLRLGHQVANGATDHTQDRPDHEPATGIDQLGAAILVAALVAAPIGLPGALPALTHPELLLAALVVALTSSVIPYVADQLAMARLPLASVALMMALLPMVATAIGAVVLHQIPTGQDLLGVALVATGVAWHRTTSPDSATAQLISRSPSGVGWGGVPARVWARAARNNRRTPSPGDRP